MADQPMILMISFFVLSAQLASLAFQLDRLGNLLATIDQRIFNFEAEYLLKVREQEANLDA